LHADYRSFSPQPSSADTFDVRRAFITVSGKIWEQFTYELSGDFANTTNGSFLDVAWINWSPWKGLQVRAGQFKMPYSLDQLTSSRFLDFTERSMLDQFVPGKERGVMVHGSPYTGFYYGLGLSNGAGRNGTETNTLADGKETIGRAAINFAELLGHEKVAVYHFGIDYSTGAIPAGSPVSTRTEARGLTFFNSTALGTADSNVKRQRGGFEASLAYGPVKLQGEWLQARYEGDDGAATAFGKKVTAYYTEALWLITGEKYAEAYSNGAYGRIRPRNNFDLKNGKLGALELGLRFSQLDAGDFPIQACGSAAPAPSATGIVSCSTTTSTALQQGTNGAQAYTVGLKWIMNPNTRVYLNYVQTHFDTPVRVRGANAAGAVGATEAFDKEQAVNLRLGVDF
jgi:phosphate-selective porin OprO/OprP